MKGVLENSGRLDDDINASDRIINPFHILPPQNTLNTYMGIMLVLDVFLRIQKMYFSFVLLNKSHLMGVRLLDLQMKHFQSLSNPLK